jgi:hypothetical protein
MTDAGFDNAVRAQQLWGGHGYIVQNGMEQFVRDARIAQIYEGANGIQALDLVGRKLGANGGRAVMAFFAEVSGWIKENEADEAMKPYAAPLKAGLGHLQQATMWFMQNGMKNPDNAGAGSYDFMHLFGLVAMGYMWGKMAKAALALNSGDRAAEMQTRLLTGKFYMERMMPETSAHLARIVTGADTLMAVPADMF